MTSCSSYVYYIHILSHMISFHSFTSPQVPMPVLIFLLAAAYNLQCPSSLAFAYLPLLFFMRNLDFFRYISILYLRTLLLVGAASLPYQLLVASPISELGNFFASQFIGHTLRIECVIFLGVPAVASLDRSTAFTESSNFCIRYPCHHTLV